MIPDVNSGAADIHCSIAVVCRCDRSIGRSRNSRGPRTFGNIERTGDRAARNVDVKNAIAVRARNEHAIHIDPHGTSERAFEIDRFILMQICGLQQTKRRRPYARFNDGKRAAVG